MTLVLDRGSDGPRVHALVLGVGSYRHLPGGSEPVTHDTLGLRQLTGPPLSARAVADWVATSLRHPRAPLGTIELLTSPGGTAGASATPAGVGPGDGDALPSAALAEVPTMAAVAAAFEAWYARCDSHEDNVALFYFCGHGVERESPFLLMEDFGRSPLALLENALDVGQTYQGMARCRAREQYFFVDACREIPFQLLQLLSGNARVLVTPQAVGDRRRDTALVYATSGGARAYGRPGRPTRFTEALLRALDGLGGRLEGAAWVVDLPSLQRAVTLLLATGLEGAPPQVPSVRGAGLGVLHTIPHAPLVPVSLACRPPSAVPAGSPQLSPLAALPGAVRGAAVPPLVASATGWSAEVPADIYTLTVDFPGGGYAPARKSIAVLPPGVYDEPVEVQP
jgi:hypothetical protein